MRTPLPPFRPLGKAIGDGSCDSSAENLIHHNGSILTNSLLINNKTEKSVSAHWISSRSFDHFMNEGSLERLPKRCAVNRTYSKPLLKKQKDLTLLNCIPLRICLPFPNLHLISLQVESDENEVTV